jgi:ATP-binding cassette subfamily B protein RaxB
VRDAMLERVEFGIGRRLPLILQTEAAECGLACLAMISGYYGGDSDLGALRRTCGLSLKGANLEDIVRIGARLGLAARAVRLELDELAMLSTPCILHWDLNHFVVLAKVEGQSITIHDPALGRRKFGIEEVSRKFTGVALELTPTSDFTAADAPPRVKFESILGRMVGLKRALAQLLLLALAIEVFGIASPLFMQWVVDHALVSADFDLLLTLIVGFGLLLLINTAVSAMRSWMIMTLSASMKVQSRANLFSHLINLPTSYFETRHLGDIMSRFGSQDSILKAITTELIEAVLDGLMAALTLIIIFLYSAKLAGIVVFGAVLYGLLRWALYRPLRQASAEAIVWGARRDSHFLETLRGVRTVKLFNALDSRRARWLNLLIETVNRQLTADKLRLLFRTSHAVLLGAITIAVIGVGARDVMNNAMSIGMLLAFISYKDQFLRRISELINKWVDLKMLRLHAERLADIALTAPEPKTGEPDQPRMRGAPSIEARRLSFRYADNDPWILKDVSFWIAPGESVAIAGPSGCGKTTLLKILAGLLQATSGEILVDGRPLRQWGAEAYRSMVGVVMQDDKLFAGSIRDNISFFADAPDLARIEDCARLAAIHDDIIGMTMGYDTLIGDMGTTLSGGQKQRLLIARALYREPKILLLDEATSHLDVKREAAVSAAIGAAHMTRIIVAHRPETIRSAERVIYLEDGFVVTEATVEAVDTAIGDAPPQALTGSVFDRLRDRRVVRLLPHARDPKWRDRG